MLGRRVERKASSASVWWAFASSLAALWMVAAGPAQAVTMRWTHFTIADPLPGSAWGTGGIPLADVDGDGDIDIVTKIWNKDGPTYHADYRRNDTVATGR